MSKERAKRRAEREAAKRARREAAEAAAAKRARRARRAERVRAAVIPSAVRRRRRVGRWARRRSKGQRTVVVVGLALVAVLVWFLVESWPVRIAVIALAVVALPALLTIAFDRSAR